MNKKLARLDLDLHCKNRYYRLIPKIKEKKKRKKRILVLYGLNYHKKSNICLIVKFDWFSTLMFSFKMQTNMVH